MNTDKISITAKERTEFGKEKMSKLRRAMKVPAVAYGPNLNAPIHLVLSLKEAQALLSHAGPDDEVTIELGNKKIQAQVKDVQVDVVTGAILHLDFYVPKPKRKSS